MILEIIFSIPVFIFIWYMIFKVIMKVQKKKLFVDIPGKMEKQQKKFYNDGKEVNVKQLLGIEEVKKDEETPETTKEPTKEAQPETPEETPKKAKEEEVKKPKRRRWGKRR